jgi:cell division transport system permease protein
MQLVGATEAFIRRPFVWKGIMQGVFSGIIALALLSGVIMAFWKNIPELRVLSSTELLLLLYVFVLVLGMLVAGTSTLFAVRKYLNMKQDRLYG